MENSSKPSNVHGHHLFLVYYRWHHATKKTKVYTVGYAPTEYKTSEKAAKWAHLMQGWPRDTFPNENPDDIVVTDIKRDVDSCYDFDNVPGNLWEA